MVVVVQSFSHVQLFATPWTVALQAPLSMGFPRQEYWSGCAISFRGSSWPRVQTWISCIAGGFFTWATRGSHAIALLKILQWLHHLWKKKSNLFNMAFKAHKDLASVTSPISLPTTKCSSHINTHPIQYPGVAIIHFAIILVMLSSKSSLAALAEREKGGKDRGEKKEDKENRKEGNLS